MSSTPNPFQSPTLTSNDHNYATSWGGRPRFRWRVVPVTLLIIFAAVTLVGAAVHLGASLRWRAIQPPEVAEMVGPTDTEILWDCVAIVSGSIVLIAACFLQMRHYRLASLLLGMAAAIVMITIVLEVCLGS